MRGKGGEGGRCSLYAELKRRGGAEKRGEEEEEEGGARRSSVVFEPLIEEEVGRQVLVLLAGEVGLDHQSLGET